MMPLPSEFIGAADGPTSILVSQVLGSRYVGPIAVAAYSYMALVPIVQTLRYPSGNHEKGTSDPYARQALQARDQDHTYPVPIIVTFLVGLISPASVSLVGFLMFGNLLRGMRRTGQSFRNSTNLSCQPDHPAAGASPFPSACAQMPLSALTRCSS
mgnify:CR=1 FL=1